jgi:hypothetical protein
MPNVFTFKPPLPPGQTTNLAVMITVTGPCATDLCLFISAHDSNFVECCSLMHCITNPVLPNFACPPDLTVNCHDGTGALVNYTLPPATNPCCPGPVLGIMDPPLRAGPIGVTAVTCEAIDACTNTSLPCCFSVTVRVG